MFTPTPRRLFYLLPTTSLTLSSTMADESIYYMFSKRVPYLSSRHTTSTYVVPLGHLYQGIFVGSNQLQMRQEENTQRRMPD